MSTNRLTCMGLTITLLAILALCATIVPAAQAENSLRWKVEGAELKENETREITITRWSANPASPEPLVLENAAKTLKISCEEASVVAGKSYLYNEKNGTTSRAASRSEPVFNNCRQTGNGAEPGCTVEQPIKSKPTYTELVLSDNNPGIGKKVLGEADPVKGEEFVAIKFKEQVAGNCKVNPIVLKGLVLGSGFTDPLTPGAPSSPTEIERGVNATTEYSSFLVKSPDEPNPNSIYLWSAGEFNLFIPTGLKVGSETAKITGTVLISLAKNGKPDGEKGALVDGEKGALVE